MLLMVPECLPLSGRSHSIPTHNPEYPLIWNEGFMGLEKCHWILVIFTHLSVIAHCSTIIVYSDARVQGKGRNVVFNETNHFTLEKEISSVEYRFLAFKAAWSIGNAILICFRTRIPGFSIQSDENRDFKSIPLIASCGRLTGQFLSFNRF